MSQKKIKTCLGLIPARGGSKGIPKKNIRQLAGQPLIAYPIQMLKACPSITRVLVSTDSEEIAQIARNYGADVPFMRPAEFATDTARQEDAILHAMDWCEKNDRKYDYICLQCPVTPLGRTATLDRAFEMLADRPDAEAVFSVTPAGLTPGRCNTLRPDGTMKDWMDPRIKWLNRQEIPVYYRLSSLIAISTWDAFRREKTFIHDKTLTIDVDKVEGIDVDTPFDFFLVERLLEKKYFNSKQLYDYLQEMQTAARP